MKLYRQVAITALALFALSAQAEIRLPKVFSSHMVLQQSKPIQIWGWANPNETVTVKLAAQTLQINANEKGEWKAVLQSMPAGGPFTLTVSGSSNVTLEDVMIGEVWLCSGQSNMEMGIRMCENADQEVAAANYPNVRLLMVPKRWSATPESDMNATWKVCSPTTVAENGWGGFSASAYYFGRELHKQLGVAVGLIDASWGGTLIQPWTTPEGFESVPALKGDSDRVKLGDPRTPSHQARATEFFKTMDNWLANARKAVNDQAIIPSMPSYPSELLPPHDTQHATALYNGMIHPLGTFAVRGAIWYQGEANLGDGMLYAERMKGLINGWRQIWGEDLSFYYVQIAPYNYGGNPQTEARLWEAQAAVMQMVPNTGMAVVNDIGNLKDIHPKNKQDVGKRLALWALAKNYGKTDIVYSGPIFKTMKIEDGKLRLEFDHVGSGLASKDGKPLSWFEIIDADEGGFVQATAEIDGNTVVLSAPSVKHPVAMRYAWSMLAEPNLMNKEGLPVSAFRAGDVPKRDLLAINIPEAKDYQLVYDMDLSKLGHDFTYTEDNHSKITKPFSRIAYFLELQPDNAPAQYVFVSMDAFTADPAKIGIPTVAAKARFQQNIQNMTVRSNVKGLTTGENLAGGNIEFWPHNYNPSNSAKVPNASNELFDFGDEPTDPEDGYGCMQVHNHDAQQTVFALNHWNEGENADVGIGNKTDGQKDWTFSANLKNYQTGRLRVLVQYK